MIGKVMTQPAEHGLCLTHGSIVVMLKLELRLYQAACLLSGAGAGDGQGDGNEQSKDKE